MTRAETAKILAVLAASYPKFEVDDIKVQVWHEMLGDLGYSVVNIAIKKLIMQNTFPPAIAEVRRATAELMNPDRVTKPEAWGEVIRAIRNYGYYREKEAMASMSPITAQVVRYLGWREICLSEEPEILRAHFLKMYDQVAAREQKKQLLSPTMQTEIKKIAKKYDLRLIEGGNAG